jgi:HAD superfamily phosphatase
MAARVLVFDVDGVLVEVTESYREGIVQTVKHFTGQTVSRDRIQDYKNLGGWNNDFALSQELCRTLGVELSYDEVAVYFTSIFLGEGGLIEREEWLPADGLLTRLASRYRLAIFTGRMRIELGPTLDRFAPHVVFDPVITSDDVTEGKPHPEGLTRIAAACPGAELWYVGDTVDDARSSQAAGVPFIGIAAPTNSRHAGIVEVLKAQGAVAVLDDINQIEGVLP